MKKLNVIFTIFVIALTFGCSDKIEPEKPVDPDVQAIEQRIATAIEKNIGGKAQLVTQIFGVRQKREDYLFAPYVKTVNYENLIIVFEDSAFSYSHDKTIDIFYKEEPVYEDEVDCYFEECTRTKDNCNVIGYIPGDWEIEFEKLSNRAIQQDLANKKELAIEEEKEKERQFEEKKKRFGL